MSRCATALCLAAALAIGCVEPPRVYHDPVIINEESVTPVTSIPAMAHGAPRGDSLPFDGSVKPPPAGPQCDSLACDGDLAISGTMHAQSFVEGAPVIVDAVANSPYYVPVNASSIFVYPNGDTVAVVLPVAADSIGRIVRVKIMGIGNVDVHGTLNQGSGLLDTIDGSPFYSLQGISNSPYPSVSLQAFYDDPSGSPIEPHRTGWAVIAVVP